MSAHALTTPLPVCHTPTTERLRTGSTPERTERRIPPRLPLISVRSIDELRTVTPETLGTAGLLRRFVEGLAEAREL